MRRRMLAPLAGLVALAIGGLSGCSVEPPAPSPTPTPSPTVAPPIDTEPTGTPTTVNALPSGAFLRVAVTALADGDEVRLELTFDRAQTSVLASDAFAGVREACASAIDSQLEINPGSEPTGVITSELAMVGDWPAGMTVGIAAGGTVASYGEGRSVAPTKDEPGAFGCTVPIVTGPGSATFTSLLLGDPAVADRLDLEAQIANGIFGFESDADSAVEVRWVDCVIQLSSAAQRVSNQFGWTPPARWGDGCLIGDDGTV